MNCKYCGTNLHPSAERCWKCGGGLTFETEIVDRQLADSFIVPNDEIRFDAELSEAFDTLIERHSYIPEDSNEKQASDIFDLRMKRLLVPLSDETEVTTALSERQSKQPELLNMVIRRLRLFLGEEPEPAVLTPEMKVAITTILWHTAILPASGLGLVVLAIAAREFWLFLVSLVTLPITLCIAGARLFDIWKFGKLKRMVREEKKALSVRYHQDDNSSNSHS